MSDAVQRAALIIEQYHNENADVFHPGDLAELLIPELAEAWRQGFTACQMRVSKQLLALLPQQIDTTNPFT